MHSRCLFEVENGCGARVGRGSFFGDWFVTEEVELSDTNESCILTRFDWLKEGIWNFKTPEKVCGRRELKKVASELRARGGDM